MKQDIHHFINLLDILQKADPELPIQYARCLCEISLDEGLSLTELADRTHMPLSTVSRITKALSSHKTTKRPHTLIYVETSSLERRRKKVFLSEKGKNTVQEIAQAIKGHKKISQ